MIRIVQKLAYIYGWGDISTTGELNDYETSDELINFIGAMVGVNAATSNITYFATKMSKEMINKFTKTGIQKIIYHPNVAYNPVIKKILPSLGQKIVKDTLGKKISKAIPILGALTSGTLTYVTYSKMSNRLKNLLSSYEIANPDFYKIVEKDTTYITKY